MNMASRGFAICSPTPGGSYPFADDLCRSERWANILDDYLEMDEAGKAPEGFDPELPWDVIIHNSAWGVGDQAHWWKQRVEHPANLGTQQGIQYLAATEGVPLNAVPGAKGVGKKGKEAGLGRGGGKQARAALAALPPAASAAETGQVDWARRASEHCYLWAQRRCTKGQWDCPMGRIHDPPSRVEPSPRDTGAKGPKGRGKKGAAAKAAAAAAAAGGDRPKGPAQTPPNPQSKRQQKLKAGKGPHR